MLLRSSATRRLVGLAPLAPLAVALAFNALSQHPHRVKSSPEGQVQRTASERPIGLDSDDAPVPLLQENHRVDWWFAFKFNAASFPGCSRGATRKCRFGGEVQSYKKFSQQFVYASSENGDLQEGADCVGDTTEDPIGATFDELYYGPFYYVLWNDQFYDDPSIKACTGSKGSCGTPWGHSKGMVSWNDQGEGLVLQVTTPSWPAAGNTDLPRRTDGNTLGCVDDNNVLVSQHFFALKLTKQDVTKVLLALQNASVVTDRQNPQIVNNGGPEDIQKLVESLGVKSKSVRYTEDLLSTGVRLISKPSGLHVPPWQMVSAILGGDPLRTATWWASPQIYSTDSLTPIACWSPSLGKAGAVEIAISGSWRGTKFGLTGGPGPDYNHAKVGVSNSGDDHYSIFGDMNQQGSLSGPNCASSQNGRGGLFYVVSDPGLFESIRNLIAGDTAPKQASCEQAIRSSSSDRCTSFDRGEPVSERSGSSFSSSR